MGKTGTATAPIFETAKDRDAYEKRRRRIETAIRERGYGSRAALARHMGMAEATVGRIVNGREISEPQLTRIERGLAETAS